MKVEIRKNRTRRVAGEIADALDQVLDRSANRVLAGAQQRIVANGSVDTGNLLNSGQVQKPRKLRRIIGFTAEYAADVELGTQAHIIKPREERMAEYRAKLAEWEANREGPRPRPPTLFWPGAAHPVAQVTHPGTHPKPFLRPALDDELPKFKEDVRTLEKDMRSS